MAVIERIVVKRGPDEGCEVDVIRLDPPLVLTDPQGREERRRWQVRCAFHEDRRIFLRTRREADKDARRPGTWCNECRMERREEDHSTSGGQ
jgi:hypothetical protein